MKIQNIFENSKDLSASLAGARKFRETRRKRTDDPAANILHKSGNADLCWVCWYS